MPVAGANGVTTDPAPACATGPTDEVLSTPARLRRVTPDEYDRTIRALVGQGVSYPRLSFPADLAEGAFHNGAASLRVTDLLTEALWAGAGAIASKATEQLSLLLPCDPASGEEACARLFLAQFARRAYRRPLTPGEVDNLLGVYRLGRDGQDFRAGISLALEVIFQSPNLLYRTELGAPDGSGITGGEITLTADELATELSYLLSAGPPDSELVTAAASGELFDAVARERQAKRLLATAGASAALAAFADDWLGIYKLDTLSKDPLRFKDKYSAELALSMRRETEALMSDVVLSGDASLRSLLQTQYTFVDSNTAKLYGLDLTQGTLLPSGLTRIKQRPERVGILGTAAVLAAQSGSLDSSPTHRGKLLRNQLFCQDIPPPPKELMVMPIAASEALTTRERYAQHSFNPACGSCHRLMDPLGFAFEHFDAIGAYRDTEANKPIDTTGEVNGALATQGNFDGAASLAAILGDSREVRACFAKQWSSYAMARSLTKEDTCALSGFAAGFGEGTSSIVDLMLALVRSKSFVVRRIPPN